MKAYTGASTHEDAALAAAEASAGWPAENPSVIFAFSSAKQDAGALRASFEQRYPGALVVGCSTSGERVDGAHQRGGVSAAALYTHTVRWHAELIAPLDQFDPKLAHAAVARAFAALDVPRGQVEPEQLVAILLTDGLSCREEQVAAAVADALDGVPLVGGSAGDDLAFKATFVSAPGVTRSNAAVLVLARGPANFYRVLKHQHFGTRAVGLAVTRADAATRRVFELDGYPAADAYARAIGVPRAELAERTFLSPVQIMVQGRPYVRSVQSVNDDGSLTFYCAVDEGWILDLSTHRPMDEALDADLGAATGAREPAGFLLAFNCILRALEAESRGLHGPLEQTLQKVADHTVGFDTYGEVLDGLHINQTLVALLLDRAA